MGRRVDGATGPPCVRASVNMCMFILFHIFYLIVWRWIPSFARLAVAAEAALRGNA